jgi:ferredoxin-like protein FixX
LKKGILMTLVTSEIYDGSFEGHFTKPVQNCIECGQGAVIGA